MRVLSISQAQIFVCFASSCLPSSRYTIWRKMNEWILAFHSVLCFFPSNSLCTPSPKSDVRTRTFEEHSKTSLRRDLPPTSFCFSKVWPGHSSRILKLKIAHHSLTPLPAPWLFLERGRGDRESPSSECSSPSSSPLFNTVPPNTRL